MSEPTTELVLVNTWLVLSVADAGISCNVIAGLARDHQFVAWDQRARALTLLREV